jgi:hemoglobin
MRSAFRHLRQRMPNREAAMTTTPRHDDRPEAPAARRAASATLVAADTGIDRPLIERLVNTFYERVRADPILGPVFAARIVDWGPHLLRMYAFWSSVTLRTGDYHGRPMQAHAPLPVDAAHFDRWLALFAATADDICPPAAAALFKDRARTIAESLEMGISLHRGHMLAKGERLTPARS